MSLTIPTKLSESDIKFLQDCAKLRDSNGSPVVSKGDKDECDYDESKEILLDDTVGLPYWFIEPEQRQQRKATKKYAKPKTKEMDLKELFEIAAAIKRQKKKVKPHIKTT